MQPNTHAALSRRLCGEPVSVSAGAATVVLELTDEMRADDRGLVHGGFVFGAADYAAMLAVNDPLVVLGSASVKFVAPTAVGDRIEAVATTTERDGRKHSVDVEVTSSSQVVFRGQFVCFVPPRHVLDGKEGGA